MSNSKTQAFKHMDCQWFCLVLALLAPHANGVIVVDSNTPADPCSLESRDFSDSALILCMEPLD